MRIRHIEKYQPGVPPTILVIGLARGGTSLVAGILSRLGVFMGDEVHAPNYEDHRLTRIVLSGDHQEIQNLVREYNSRTGPLGWGTKNPGLNTRLVRQLSVYRNPLILLVKKDLLSVASLRSKVFSVPYPLSVFRTLLAYAMLRRMVLLSGAPVIEVRYADIVREPQAWLAEFVGCLDFRFTDTKAALSFVNEGKKDYQDWKNRTVMPYQGFVEVVDATHVRGWARHKTENRPVTVEIRVEGRAALSVRADIYRQDVAERVQGSDGCCGFKVNFDPPLTIQEQQSVEASVAKMVLLRLP